MKAQSFRSVMKTAAVPPDEDGLRPNEGTELPLSDEDGGRDLRPVISSSAKRLHFFIRPQGVFIEKSVFYRSDKRHFFSGGEGGIRTPD